MPKKVRMSFDDIDNNDFAVIEAFSENAEQQGWTLDEIRVVIRKFQAADDCDSAMTALYEHIESEEEN